MTFEPNEDRFSLANRQPRKAVAASLGHEQRVDTRTGGQHDGERIVAEEPGKTSSAPGASEQILTTTSPFARSSSAYYVERQNALHWLQQQDIVRIEH
ncbi:hypothetical protein [Rhizobium croatiense]|nr:hypothetical protein [Rhizobium croatiense]